MQSHLTAWYDYNSAGMLDWVVIWLLGRLGDSEKLAYLGRWLTTGRTVNHLAMVMAHLGAH